MKSIEEAKALIEGAFSAARAGRKQDWHRMTAAVLKNRMLSLSDRTFDEADYGFDSFTSFLEGVATDFLILDRDGYLTVELAHALEPDTHRAGRVRSDLWKAVMDYSSEQRYYWSRHAHRAEADDASGGPLLPTVTREEFLEWRKDFADTSCRSLSQMDAIVLRGWSETTMGTGSLPPKLRPLWNEFLKERVVRRLTAWFDEHAVPAPTDLVSIEDRPQVQGDRDHHIRDLRRFVSSVVMAMTRSELAELRLPPEAIVRAGVRIK